jgi:elongation factor P
MADVSEVKRGFVLRHLAKNWIVRDVDKSAPTSRGGQWVYRFKLESIPAGQKTDVALRGGDQVEEADLVRRHVSLSYTEGDNYIFMDNEDYSQFTLSKEAVGDLPLFYTEGLEGIQILIVNEAAVGVQLPPQVELEVVDTPPYLKGASATGRGKPARLSTGLEVQVPEYIENGVRIRVSTETYEYLSRA